MVVLAVDPGNRKCGLAIVSRHGGILHRAIVAPDRLGEAVSRLVQDHRPQRILVGGSTGSSAVVEILREATGLEVEIVDERHTTEAARRRYFEEHPPRGWRRLIPLGLQVPGEPYDDYAAVVIAERFLEMYRRGENDG